MLIPLINHQLWQFLVALQHAYLKIDATANFTLKQLFKLHTNGFHYFSSIGKVLKERGIVIHKHVQHSIQSAIRFIRFESSFISDHL